MTLPLLSTEKVQHAAARALDSLELPSVSDLPFDLKLALIEDVATDLADQLSFYKLAMVDDDPNEEER